jgi:glycerol-3-phosphate dehydrogenase (NAD(P)+)
MRIAVLGAGAWGTALAVNASARNEVMLWARDGAQLRSMREQATNQRYLPEVALPANLAMTAQRDEALAYAQGGLLIVATPMAALREQLAALPPLQPVLWLCKGFEPASGALGHEIARELRPQAACGVLSGPSFALEVARGQPTAIVAASGNAELVALAVAALHGATVRVYASDDPIGVEVGGAVKNVLAIATGIADALSLGATRPCGRRRFERADGAGARGAAARRDAVVRGGDTGAERPAHAGARARAVDESRGAQRDVTAVTPRRQSRAGATPRRPPPRRRCSD